MTAGGPNISRMMSALATPSPRLGEAARSEQDTVDAMRGFVVGDVGELKVPANGSARQVMADALKEMLSNATGINHQDFSVSEVLDAIQYFAFPNFVPWAGYGVPIVYRFRPYGNDPDQCIMEVMLLYLGQAEGQQTPPEIRWLKPEEPWSAAEELGGLGAIFDQDDGQLCRHPVRFEGRGRRGADFIELPGKQSSALSPNPACLSERVIPPAQARGTQRAAVYQRPPPPPPPDWRGFCSFASLTRKARPSI